MLVSCDASGLEWRVLLELARDEVGINEVLDGADTHELNRVAFELPERRVAKFYLFRTIYRGTGFAFANDPDFMHVSTSPKYWDSIGEKFYKKYHGVDRTHQLWKDLVVAGHPIVGPSGRIWSISMGRDWKGDLKIPWTILTNYPVQGTGADVMMLARISFWRRLTALQIPSVKLVSTVHDSIVVDTPTQYISQIVDLFYGVFDDLIENIWRCFKYKWIVPLGCEVKIGMDMLNMEKVDRSIKLT